jgi:hypothetical protein
MRTHILIEHEVNAPKNLNYFDFDYIKPSISIHFLNVSQTSKSTNMKFRLAKTQFPFKLKINGYVSACLCVYINIYRLI